MTTGRRRPLAAAAWVLTLGLLAGCSGDPARPPAPAQTTTPTVSATTAPPAPTVPPPPLLPAAAARADQQGAEAFFRYFWDVYSWSYAANDWAILDSISTSDCRFCVDTVADLQDASSKQLVTKGGAVSVGVAVAAFGQPERGLTVLATVDQQSSIQESPAGAVVSTSPARAARRVDAVVKWAGTAWQMASIQEGQDR